ncbi:MAG: amidase [Acidobacteriota bacterium]
MPRGTLSPGQRTLLSALQRLEQLQLGASEPAVTFRPRTWAVGTSAGFDLQKIADDLQDTDEWKGALGKIDDGGQRGKDVQNLAPEKAGASGRDRAGTGSGTYVEGRENADVGPPLPGIVELVAAVNGRQTDPLEIAERALERIEALNPRLNAVVTTTAERARSDAARLRDALEAGERPRPLAGVPLLHKDLICTRGIRTTAGSRLLAGYVPAHDAAVAARLANAGTLLVGKANTHEFATGTTGTASCFGPTRNPWDTSRVAGGSSSGSAAALAAGLVAAATGSDTGGSIRIPAACCGVVGIKPTYGRVSRAGVIPFAWSLDHVGPMARSVADVAALLTAMCGHDPQDPASAEEPGTDFSISLSESLEGMRFAMPAFQFLELARAEVAGAVREAGKALEQLGAQKVEVEMPAELAEVGPAAVAIFLAEGGAIHATTLEAAAHAYQPETYAFLSLASEVSGRAYLQAQRLRALLAASMAQVFQATDLLVVPTLPITAPPLDARLVDGPEGPLDVRAALTLFTRPFNLTGLPALSVPCGFDAQGLPIGLQIVGRPFEEAAVLCAGHAYQQATDWHHRRPTGFD